MHSKRITKLTKKTILKSNKYNYNFIKQFKPQIKCLFLVIQSLQGPGGNDMHTVCCKIYISYADIRLHQTVLGSKTARCNSSR